MSPADARCAREQRIDYIKWAYECSREDALRFIALRNEGYSITQAALMAGIADPQEHQHDTAPN